MGTSFKTEHDLVADQVLELIKKELEKSRSYINLSELECLSRVYQRIKSVQINQESN